MFHLRGDLESKLFIRTLFIVRSAVLSVSPSFRGKVKTVSLTERSPNQLLRPTAAEKWGQLAGQFHFFCFKDLKSQQVISLSEFFFSSFIFVSKSTSHFTMLQKLSKWEVKALCVEIQEFNGTQIYVKSLLVRLVSP